MNTTNIDKLLVFLNSKKDKHTIRVTTQIRGELKNRFINDCISREENETKVANNALGVYYILVDRFPEMNQMDYVDLKKYITEKIKL